MLRKNSKDESFLNTNVNKNCPFYDVPERPGYNNTSSPIGSPTNKSDAKVGYFRQTIGNMFRKASDMMHITKNDKGQD